MAFPWFQVKYIKIAVYYTAILDLNTRLLQGRDQF